MISQVHLVLHSHLDKNLFNGRSDKIIGVCSSESKATEAINSRVKLPGFSKSADGFVVYAIVIDKDLSAPIPVWE